MEPAERETQLMINDADLKEGYFRFYTTKPNDFAKLCKRIGGKANLIELKERDNGNGYFTWDCKVPLQYLSRGTFAIRVPRTMSEAQLAAAAKLGRRVLDI